MIEMLPQVEAKQPFNKTNEKKIIDIASRRETSGNLIERQVFSETFSEQIEPSVPDTPSPNLSPEALVDEEDACLFSTEEALGIQNKSAPISEIEAKQPFNKTNEEKIIDIASRRETSGNLFERQVFSETFSEQIKPSVPDTPSPNLPPETFSNIDLISLVEKSKREMRKMGSDTGDFARARTIISENKTQFIQMKQKVQLRAMQIQRACCPPGQSSTGKSSDTSSHSQSTYSLNRFSDHRNCKDEEERCPNCKEKAIDGYWVISYCDNCRLRRLGVA